MARIYSAPLTLSVTNDSSQDIFELTAGSVNAVTLVSIRLCSSYAASEPVDFSLIRRTTAGSGGSGITEVASDSEDSSPTAALVVLNTTQGTGGAVLGNFTWHQNTQDWIYLPTPDEQIKVPATTRIALALGTAVASTRSWRGQIVWKEA